MQRTQGKGNVFAAKAMRTQGRHYNFRPKGSETTTQGKDTARARGNTRKRADEQGRATARESFIGNIRKGTKIFAAEAVKSDKAKALS